jgi:hypothetical protein
LTALSNIVAQTLVVQTITSSISSITGSTNFGSLVSNTHTFTGSLLVSGSQTYALEVSGGLRMQGPASTGITVQASGSNIIAMDVNGGFVGGIGDYRWAALGSNYTDFAIQSNKNMGIFTNNSTTPSMFISASGNIGIGTSAPAAKLHSKSSNEGLRLETTATSGNNYLTFYNPSGEMGYLGYGGGANDNLYIMNEKNTDMIFFNNTTERMRITSDSHLKLTSTSGGGTNLDMYLIENDGLYINSNEGATARNIYFQTGGTERLRILSSGGITFNGDTAAANALDDYEEGTFTPSVNLLGSISYGSRIGYYTKIGNVVYYYIYIVVSSSDTTQDNTSYSISGLPFTAKSGDSGLNPLAPALTEQFYKTSNLIGIYFQVSYNNSAGTFLQNSWNNELANKTYYTSARRSYYAGSNHYINITGFYYVS